MLTHNNQTTQCWDDYELLDSGEGTKLERFGSVVTVRPETQALWKRSNNALWDTATTRFETVDGKGVWSTHIPDWTITRNDIHFTLSLTNFKHIGIFPEQDVNWDWIADRIISLTQAQSAGGVFWGRELSEANATKVAGEEFCRFENSAYASDSSHRQNSSPATISVINLFGYTGAASIAAAHAGARVTHLDASHQSLDWAHENARLSRVPEDRIRYIPEDALRFARREVKRGNRYDGIILDPPAFGRGAKGEVWKIEEHLPELLELTKELLTEKHGSFFLLNGYAAGYSAISFKQLVESAFGESLTGEYGELLLKESNSSRSIPTGVYVRFVY